MAVKDGEASKLHPKLPNVIPETHRNGDFSYFFLPSAAAPSVQKTAAGWESTMAVKVGEASKLHPKTPWRNFWNP